MANVRLTNRVPQTDRPRHSRYGRASRRHLFSALPLPLAASPLPHPHWHLVGVSPARAIPRAFRAGGHVTMQTRLPDLPSAFRVRIRDSPAPLQDRPSPSQCLSESGSESETIRVKARDLACGQHTLSVLVPIRS